MTERRFILLLLYAVAFLLAHWLAFQLRFDFKVPDSSRQAMMTGWWLTLPVKLLWLVVFGQFTGLLGYFSMPDLWRVSYAMTCASGILLVAGTLDVPVLRLPRGVILTDYVLSAAAVVAPGLWKRAALSLAARTSRLVRSRRADS